MISFLKIGCKITQNIAHSQTKCTKTALLCTKLDFCANNYWVFPWLFANK